MNTYKMRMPIGCMITALILTGCVHSNIAGFAPAPTQYATDADDTLSARVTKAAASGEAVIISTNGRTINYGSGEPTVTKARANISLAYADNAGSNEIQSVTVETSNGSLTFDRDELVNATDFEKRDAHGNFLAGLFASHGGSWDEYANGDGAHQFMIPGRASIVNDDGSIDRGYAVVGLESTDIVVAARTGTATYTGVLDDSNGGFKGDALVAGSTTRTKLLGDVTLNADFGAGEITGGQISNIRRDNGDAYGVSALDIGESDFYGNGFSSTVSCVSASTCDNGAIADGSSFAGTFYGDNAQETGGTANWNWEAGTGSTLSDHTVGAVWTANVGN